MCGGISSLLTLGLAPENRRSTRVFAYLIAYNTGRITSYVLAGAIIGGLGGLLVELSDLHALQRSLQFVTAGIMILLGLYIANIVHFVSHLEKIGYFVWRHLRPIGQQFLPVKSIKSALFLGVIWGWLPCGLVYSALIATLGSGNGVNGAMLMLAFGLGTLPALLGMGLFAASLGRFLQRKSVRLTAGFLVIVIAIIQLYHAI